MPRRSAAWMTVRPSSTAIEFPSISILGIDAPDRGAGSLFPAAAPRGPFSRLGAQRATAEGGVLLELGAELCDKRPGRHRGAVGQRADGVTLDVVGDVQQEVDVGRCRPAVLEVAQDAVEPSRAFATGCALP